MRDCRGSQVGPTPPIPPDSPRGRVRDAAHVHKPALLCWQSAKPGKLSKREIMEIVCLQTPAKAHPTFYLLF